MKFVISSLSILIKILFSAISPGQYIIFQPGRSEHINFSFTANYSDQL